MGKGAEQSAGKGTAPARATTRPTTRPTAPRLLKAGLHPGASAALEKIGFPVERIGQVIGHAAASKGTHEADGTCEGHAYTCAMDLRVGGWDRAEIRGWLDKLGSVGIAAWYRCPGEDGWSGAAHLHAVWAGAPMKAGLQRQVHDYCHGRNGLASHAPYRFHARRPADVETVRALFLAHNPAVVT